MAAANEETVRIYAEVLRYAIVKLRMRLRFGEQVPLDEVHDLLDAVHNIPQMLADYGEWFVEENIDGALKDYDAKWLERQSGEFRLSLVEALERAKRGEMPF